MDLVRDDDLKTRDATLPCGGRGAVTENSLIARAQAEIGARELAIQFRDEAGADFRGANRFAFVGVGAVPKTFGVHHADHFQDARLAFRLTLRKERKV